MEREKNYIPHYIDIWTDEMNRKAAAELARIRANFDINKVVNVIAAFNSNPGASEEDAKAELLIVGEFAKKYISGMNLSPEGQYDTLDKITNLYSKYIRQGHPASRNFDPFILFTLE